MRPTEFSIPPKNNSEPFPMVILVGGKYKSIHKAEDLPTGKDLKIIKRRATLLTRQNMKVGYWYADYEGLYKYCITYNEGNTMLLCLNRAKQSVFAIQRVGYELPQNVIVDVD